jgi:signal transduction histidine kinase
MLEDRELAPHHRDAIREELRTALDDLARNHRELAGDARRVAEYSTELERAYSAAPQDLDRRLRAFIETARAGLDGVPAAVDAHESKELRALLNWLAGEHAAEVERHVARMARLDALLLAVNLTLLLLAAVFVFRPMVARVRDQFVRLRKTNYELRARGRELEQARALSLRNAGDAEEARQAAEHSRQELADHNRELETILYVISHDLREPLRAIEQFSRVVIDRYSERVDARGRDLLARTARAAVRMRTLLDDLLELSRARRVRPPDDGVDGAEIVAEALDRLSTRIEETGAKVRIARDLARVRADRTWAVAALYNLLANALKFTREGERPQIEIAPYRDARDGTTGFRVLDKGPGVAPEHAERIFRLFQRAVGREVEGTGAGLAIVAAVAERHGGRAWVQPRDGGGSEFIITFPDRGSQTPGVAA